MTLVGRKLTGIITDTCLCLKDIPYNWFSVEVIDNYIEYISELTPSWPDSDLSNQDPSMRNVTIRTQNVPPGVALAECSCIGYIIYSKTFCVRLNTTIKACLYLRLNKVCNTKRTVVAV